MHHQTAPWFCHSDHFRKRLLGVVQMGKEPISTTALKGVVRKIEPIHIADSICYGARGACGPFASFCNHRFASVNAHHSALAADQSRQG
jgi:hypothetical protein